MNFNDALKALDRETARARRTLGFERGIELALLPLGALTAWLAAAAFGLPARLPPLAASLLAFAALALTAALALRAWRRWRRPSAMDARARLAFDAGLERGAFEALEDRPSRLDPLSLALWRREKRRAADAAGLLRASRPRPDFVRTDPLQLRFLLPVLLILAAATAREEAAPRLLAAVAPDPGPLVGDKPMEIEAWVSPAAYTGQTPISLTDRVGETVETPPVAEATVRVTGPVAPPRLVFDGKHGRRVFAFEQAADGAYEAKAALDGGGTLKVERFGVKARWRIAPSADARPLAQFTAAPRAAEGEIVAFGWRAEDDFGVRAIALRLQPVDPPIGLKKARPIDTPIPAPPGDPTAAAGDATLDLAEHPYAGLEVEARIVAFDARGQEGESAPVNLRLPERAFLQPLAQAAIEIRKKILFERRPYRAAGRGWLAASPPEPMDSELGRAPQGVRRAAQMLDALTMTPQDGYFRDLAVYAGLRLSRSLLDVARSIEDTDEAARALWRTALRAEFGDSADAKTALEEAQRQLSDAIRQGASKEEIARRTETLRAAMENYIQALVADAIRSGQTPETEEDAQAQSGMDKADLDRMVEEMKARANAGDAEGAQALLQRLTALMNMLEIRLTAGPPSPGPEGAPALDTPSANDLAGELESLRNDTADASPGDQGQLKDLEDRQEKLADALDRAPESSETDPARQDAMSAAKRAMERARERLQQGDLAGAARAQEQALQALREGEGQAGEASDGARDPLGRALGGGGDGGQTRIPAEAERQRAREILDELRRRAQDPNRPETEREYLRRLLDRFNDS